MKHPLIAVCLLLLLAILSCLCAASTEDPFSHQPMQLQTPQQLEEVTKRPLHPLPTYVILSEGDAGEAKELAEWILEEMTGWFAWLGFSRPQVPISVHTYQVRPNNKKDAELYDALAPGHDGTTLIVHGAVLERGAKDSTPSLPCSKGVPQFQTVAYRGSLRDRDELRQWLLDHLPVRYADYLTQRLLPSVNVVQSKDEMRRVTAEREAALAAKSVTVPPHTVSTVLLDWKSPEAVTQVASLTIMGAVSGLGHLVFVTNDSKVAFRDVPDQLCTAPFDSVAKATSNHWESLVSVTCGEDAFAVFTTAGAQAKSASDKVLAHWRKAVSTFQEHPLRRLRTQEQLDHELFVTQKSVRLVFFLRATDDLLFTKYHKVAAEVSKRLLQSPVKYKSLSGQTKTWRPQFMISVYWVDAEQQPQLASALRVTRVPSVVLLVPLQPKDDLAATEEGYANPHAFSGARIINYHDLHVVDTSTSAYAQTAKELAPTFPQDADELFRFFAAHDFTQRIMYNAPSVKHSSLVMEAEDPAGPKASLDLYDIVDYTYYPTSAEEDNATAIVRQFLSTGVMSRDVVKAKRREPKGVSQKLREKLKAELEQRKREKEERIRKKAQSDTAARAAADAKLQREAEEALKREKAAGGTRKCDVVKRPVNIRRYPVKNDLKDFYTWRAEGKRIGQRFVKVDPSTDSVHIVSSLEDPL